MESLYGGFLWTGSQDVNWDSNSNWNPSVFPNGPNAEAIFRLPPGANSMVDTNSDITIGMLALDTPGSIDIHFTHHSLIFQTNNNSSSITVSQGDPVIDTPLVIKDKYLKVKGNPSSNLWFKGDISGTGGLIFENGLFSFSGINTYRKEAILLNSVMHAKGSGVVFPGAVSVSDGSRLFHETSNLYSPHSTLFVVNNGYVDFGNSCQSFSNLMLFKGVVVGANATVTLSNPAHVIQIKSESSIGIKNLILSNGGYMQFSSSQGIFDGSLCQEGFMAMDLGGENLNLDVHQHEAFSDFGMGFNNVIITHGSIIKIGSGSVFFSGQTGNIPSLSIQTGRVYIGKSFADLIDASGSLEIKKEGCLGGFGTLGIQGDAAVYNDGTLKPGTDNNIGILRISGSYAQSSQGILFIKALNAKAADKLIVDENEVSLDGTLVLQAQTANAFNPGDQIVILDSTNTGTPISGNFSSFNSNLPPHLNATIQYDKNQVRILITQR